MLTNNIAPLVFCQGETVTVTGGIQYVGGGAYDLTNHTVIWTLSETRGGTALLTKSTTAGTLTIVAPATLGGIRFTLSSAETDALAARTYRTEVHVKAPAPGSAEQCAGHDIAVCESSTIGAI